MLQRHLTDLIIVVRAVVPLENHAATAKIERDPRGFRPCKTLDEMSERLEALDGLSRIAWTEGARDV